MYGDAYLNFDYKDIISFYEKSKGTQFSLFIRTKESMIQAMSS